MNRREALAALVALPAVARISSAELKPNDVIVIECDRRLSHEDMLCISDTIAKVWPDRRAVVLEAGLRLKVVDAGKVPS